LTGRVRQMCRVSSFNRARELSILKLALENFAISAVFILASVFILTSSLAQANVSSITPEKVIELVNEARKERGVGELIENEKLSRAAERKVEDMVEKDYFSHNSPAGVTPWHWIEEEGYDYDYAGENLAMDFTSARKMHSSWMASPTHRANILNKKYKEIGVAVREGTIDNHQTIVVAQMFGSGDKNSSKLKKAVSVEKEETGKADEKNKTGGYYCPTLPPAKVRKSGIFPSRPFITSPQKNEVVSQDVIEVVGKSMPGVKVAIFDNAYFSASAVSDKDGWFRVELKNISEGVHSLTVNANKAGAGEKLKAGFLKSDVVFRVDRTKPRVDYHFYTSGERSREVFLTAVSSEENCFFEIGGERIKASGSSTVVIPIDSGKSAGVLKVTDRAGNETSAEIAFPNSYSYKNNKTTNKIASALGLGLDSDIIFGKAVYAAEAGVISVRDKIESDALFASIIILIFTILINSIVLVKSKIANPFIILNTVFMMMVVTMLSFLR